MLFISFFEWWYWRGWGWSAKYLLITRNIRIIQFFSVPDLLKTLFAPFRQDSLQLSNAPIGIRLQAFGMNIISRCFGLLIRSSLIVIGLISILTNTLLGMVGILIWPFLPISPVIVFILISLNIGAPSV